MAAFENRDMFEVARVWSRNTPGYTNDFDCLTTRWNVKSTAKSAGDMAVNVSWVEGRRWRREQHTGAYKLKPTELRNDWTVEHDNSSVFHDQVVYVSVLGQLGAYRLTYYCYPTPHEDEEDEEEDSLPAYIIAVDSYEELFDYHTADSLLLLAGKLELNPGGYRPQYMRHKYCDPED